jgi:predicted glycosyltransferase
VKIVYAQEGIIQNDGGMFQYYTPEYQDYYPDYYFLHNQNTKHILEHTQIPVEKLKIVGNPRYDYIQYLPANHNALCKKYGLDPEKPVILWTPQAHYFSKEENQLNNKLLFGFFKDFTHHYQFVVKPHPKERNIRQYNKKIAKVLPDADTYELLQICSCCLLKTSATGFEAALLGKPFLIFNPMKEKLDVDYVNYDFDIVYNIEQLKYHLNSIRKNEYPYKEVQQQYLRDKMDYYGTSARQYMKTLSEEVMT